MIIIKLIHMAYFIIIDNQTIMITQDNKETTKDKLVNKFKKLFDDDE